MTRSLILLGAALAAVAWLISQPAFAHDTPHKQAGALIAIAVPFLAADIILAIRKKRRARARPAQLPAASRARAGAGRW
jgi:drug/metabolite transporter (DMT)-like permease